MNAFCLNSIVLRLIQLLPSDRPHCSNEGGDEEVKPDDIELQPGWIWQDKQWSVSMARAVDTNGWEYAFDFGGPYFPAKKKVEKGWRLEGVNVYEIL